MAVLLFSVGAETPLLALLSLRRPRNLLAVVAPYLVLVPLALAIGALWPRLAVGALVLALAPAELAAGPVARAVGGRMETAGAVVAGTLLVSLGLLLVVFGTAGAGAAVNTALFAFVVGAAIAGSLPTLRDQLLPVIRAASTLALGVLIGAAVIRSLPAVAPDALAAAALVLVAGVGAAGAVGLLLGGDLRGLALGGGTRDFAVAATLAFDLAGDDAAATALVYGGLLFGLLGIALLVRRVGP